MAALAGNPIKVEGTFPKVGDKAQILIGRCIEGRYAGKFCRQEKSEGVKVAGYPTLRNMAAQIQTRKLANTVVLIITTDFLCHGLAFAMSKGWIRL